MAEDARFCASCGTPVEPSGGGSAESEDGGPATEVIGVEDTVVATPGDTTDPDLAPVGAGEEDLQVCPRCGASNSSSRMLCGRCGGDLAGGAPPSRPRPAPSPPAGGEEGVQTQRRTGLLVVVLAILGGLAVGAGLLATGVIGGDTEGAAPTFDPALYPDPPDRLEIREVAASSAAEGAGPGRLADGDLATAWHSDGAANPAGVGERVTLRTAGSVWVTSVVIAPGDQGGAAPYGRFARPVALRVTVGDGETFRIELLDQPGRQQAGLPEPVLTTTVAVEVLASARGEDPALAISEIAVLGHPAPGVSPGG